MKKARGYLAPWLLLWEAAWDRAPLLPHSSVLSSVVPWFPGSLHCFSNLLIDLEHHITFVLQEVVETAFMWNREHCIGGRNKNVWVKSIFKFFHLQMKRQPKENQSRGLQRSSACFNFQENLLRVELSKPALQKQNYWGSVLNLSLIQLLLPALWVGFLRPSSKQKSQSRICHMIESHVEIKHRSG